MTNMRYEGSLGVLVDCLYCFTHILCQQIYFGVLRKRRWSRRGTGRSWTRRRRRIFTSAPPSWARARTSSCRTPPSTWATASTAPSPPRASNSPRWSELFQMERWRDGLIVLLRFSRGWISVINIRWLPTTMANALFIKHRQKCQKCWNFSYFSRICHIDIHIVVGLYSYTPVQKLPSWGHK